MVAVADDGAWVCAWTTGPGEGRFPLLIVAMRVRTGGKPSESTPVRSQHEDEQVNEAEQRQQRCGHQAAGLAVEDAFP